MKNTYLLSTCLLCLILLGTQNSCTQDDLATDNGAEQNIDNPDLRNLEVQIEIKDYDAKPSEQLLLLVSDNDYRANKIEVEVVDNKIQLKSPDDAAELGLLEYHYFEPGKSRSEIVFETKQDELFFQVYDIALNKTIAKFSKDEGLAKIALPKPIEVGHLRVETRLSPMPGHAIDSAIVSIYEGSTSNLALLDSVYYDSLTISSERRSISWPYFDSKINDYRHGIAFIYNVPIGVYYTGFWDHGKQYSHYFLLGRNLKKTQVFKNTIQSHTLQINN